MADESKRYPPTERKLARMWQAGATAASPSLVAVTVLAAAAALVLIAGPALQAWMSGWLRAGLRAAAQPETALTTSRAIALRGGLVAGGIALVTLLAAVAVQVAQRGNRPDAGAPAASTRERSSPLRVDGWRGARAILLTGAAGVAVAATVRAALLTISGMPALPAPATTFADLLGAVGRPLLIVLIAVAVLDALAERAVWLRGAWMTRAEVEEETREAEGHPLTRERRSVASRRRRDA